MGWLERARDYSDPNSLGSRFRRARSRRLRDLIDQIFAATGQCRILDLGGRADYWAMFEPGFLAARKVHITIVNPEPVETTDPMFDSQVGDACDLGHWPNNRFDLCHSNSVIEHVGDWPRMVAFAGELRRLAPRYYVQCPYFWFPVEPHFSALFFHWWPESHRAARLLRGSVGVTPRAPDMSTAMVWVQHARLLDKRQMGFLFPEADHPNEVIFGITKSLVAVRD